MKKVTLRIPDELHEELCLIAHTEERSLNSQLLYLLRKAVKGVRFDHERAFVPQETEHDLHR